MKVCPSCKVEKPVTEYGRAASRKDGLSPYCKACSREKANALAKRPDQQAKRKAYYEANKETLLGQAKERWSTRRDAYEPARQRWAAEHREETLAWQREHGTRHREFVDALKAGKPCLDCAESYPPYVMEYDHVRGEKRHNIGKMGNHKRERVIEEIEKCDLVCCACHRVRSHARRKPPTTPKLVAYRAWLDTLKAVPCADCGRTRPPEAMDFDHADGDKVQNITDMWSWGRDKVVAEIAKCQLVCANCHRVRTVQRLRQG